MRFADIKIFPSIARSILSVGIVVPAMVLASGAWAQAKNLSVPVEGEATHKKRGCPVTDISVAQSMDPAVDNDPVYVFYKDMYITTDKSDPAASSFADCEITVNLKYKPGYRYVFRAGVHGGRVIVANGLTTEIATTYRFEDGREFSYDSSFKGPHSEFYQHRSADFSGEAYRSDCSGYSTIKISKLIDLGIMNGSDEGKSSKDDDDKDDISMAFISRDNLELEWEKCPEGEK